MYVQFAVNEAQLTMMDVGHDRHCPRGQAKYIIYSRIKERPMTPSRGNKVVLPGVRVLNRLAKTLLRCEYQEIERRESHIIPRGGGQDLEFVIGARIPVERKLAFLGAVAAHTRVI